MTNYWLCEGEFVREDAAGDWFGPLLKDVQIALTIIVGFGILIALATGRALF